MPIQIIFTSHTHTHEIKSINKLNELPEPILGWCFTIHFGNKMTNERFLIKCCKIGTQEIMTNPIHTVMVKLWWKKKRIRNKSISFFFVLVGIFFSLLSYLLHLNKSIKIILNWNLILGNYIWWKHRNHHAIRHTWSQCLHCREPNLKTDMLTNWI